METKVCTLDSNDDDYATDESDEDLNLVLRESEIESSKEEPESESEEESTTGVELLETSQESTTGPTTELENITGINKWPCH